VSGVLQTLRRSWPALGLPLVLIVVALVGARWFAPETAASRLLDTPAPAFSLPIVAGAGAAQHDRLALDSLRGQVVVLDFWASWCPPCRQSVPILDRVHRSQGAHHVRVIGINLEPDLAPAAVAAVHRRLGASYPTLQDRTGETQQAYGIEQLPTLVVIGADGMVRHVETGVPDEDRLHSKILSLLGGLGR